MHLFGANLNIKILVLASFFCLTTFNISNSNFGNSLFKIENIFFNKTIYFEEPIKSEILDYLNNESLLFVSKKKITNIITKSNWVNHLEIKKEFPKNITINIKEFFPIGYYYKNNQLYIINSKFLISKFNQEIDLKNIIRFNEDLDLDQIKVLYNILIFRNEMFSNIYQINYFKNNRWDIILKDKKIIKLGDYDINEQLDKLDYFVNDEKVHTIDLRIKNRITIGYVE